MVKNILRQESINIPEDDNFYQYLYDQSQGDLRKYINTLHSVSIIDTSLSIKNLYNLYGHTITISIEDIKNKPIDELLVVYHNFSINSFVDQCFDKVYHHLTNILRRGEFKKNTTQNKTQNCDIPLELIIDFIIEYEKVLQGITLCYTYNIYIISILSIAKKYLLKLEDLL